MVSKADRESVKTVIHLSVFMCNAVNEVGMLNIIDLWFQTQGCSRFIVVVYCRPVYSQIAFTLIKTVLWSLVGWITYG